MYTQYHITIRSLDNATTMALDMQDESSCFPWDTINIAIDHTVLYYCHINDSIHRLQCAVTLYCRLIV